MFSTPDDGCCDTRNMYSSFAVNKYLHTVASGWIFINILLTYFQYYEFMAYVMICTLTNRHNIRCYEAQWLKVSMAI